MTVLTQAHAEALRRVTTYLAEEHDDMQMYVTRGGGNPKDHIAYYVTVLEDLLNAYNTAKGESK
jgi:hypothetical protein